MRNLLVVSGNPAEKAHLSEYSFASVGKFVAIGIKNPTADRSAPAVIWAAKSVNEMRQFIFVKLAINTVHMKRHPMKVNTV